jgi:hypothetical protein
MNNQQKGTIMNFIKSIFSKAFAFITRNLGKTINTISHLITPVVLCVSGGKDKPAFTGRIILNAFVGVLALVGLGFIVSQVAVAILIGLTYVLSFVLPLLFANVIALVLTILAVHFTVEESSKVDIKEIFFAGFTNVEVATA